MSFKTKIEWTENTWNPITGCTKYSDGCANCYAYTMANRLKAMGLSKYKNGFDVSFHSGILEEPLRIKKPSVFFVNSMSDIYHEDVSVEQIKQIFDVMNGCSHHTFQLLTKRADRMLDLSEKFLWTPNIWQGITVESNKYAERIEKLRKMPSHIKFISFEPLLSGFSSINLECIDWAIVGGESGNGARAIDEKWILDIKEACEFSSTKFYFKQWGGRNKKKSGRELLGRTWDDRPLLCG